MILTVLMLVVALSLSSVAAFYSIVGLAAIFSAAVIPIIIMGSILEVAKLVVTVWLHEYWKRCRIAMKLYLVPAVGVLMLLTSMGIFGFLSRAHLDQAVPTGDVAANVSLIDEKIRTERENIDVARRALAQMDSQVDQRLSRSDSEQGAERAVQIRRAQARERQQLQAEIQSAQKKIAALNEERAPIASQLRKAEAEVGPIKYIAALIYGDNPDQNLLERAVRWVIIVLVLVFDPLAVMMLLAATESWTWEREAKTQKPREKITQPIESESDKKTFVWPQVPVVPRPDLSSAVPISKEIDQNSDDDIENETDSTIKEAMRIWKSLNPGGTVKNERHKLRKGLIKVLPWMQYVKTSDTKTKYDFGAEPPGSPARGDFWIQTTIAPHTLHKYNGKKWIVVDKNNNTSYINDDRYIDFLIGEIQSNRYDADLLTDIEADQIQQKLGNER